MIISNEKSIQEIQREFKAHFPYLKIEFYDTEHAAGEGSPPNREYRDQAKTVGEIRKRHNADNLTIHSHVKVSTIESELYRKYGLNAQIFRRSGTCWLQTIATDHWTLAQQNSKAKSYDDRKLAQS